MLEHVQLPASMCLCYKIIASPFCIFSALVIQLSFLLCKSMLFSFSGMSPADFLTLHLQSSKTETHLPTSSGS